MKKTIYPHSTCRYIYGVLSGEDLHLINPDADRTQFRFVRSVFDDFGDGYLCTFSIDSDYTRQMIREILTQANELGAKRLIVRSGNEFAQIGGLIVKDVSKYAAENSWKTSKNGRNTLIHESLI